MAVTMMIPALADLRAGNNDWTGFVRSSLTIFTIASLVFMATREATAIFSARLGFFLTVCLWLTACLLGMLPLYFSGRSLDFAQSLFESVSAVTSTGATVLTGLDNMPQGILLWRSLLCWIGGIGFIGLALLLLPSLRVGGIRLFHMESSEKSEKILPRVNQISNALMIAYLGLTLVCTLCYFFAGMSLFDAVNHAMSTIATTGFSTHDASFGYFADKPAVIFFATIFMVLSALPFIVYATAFIPGQKKRLGDQQIRLFIFLCIVCSTVLALWLSFTREIPFSSALLKASFHFTSVLSTTSFSTEDYSQWGAFAIGIFFLACFCGGCAGSTSGGIKMNRLIILWRLVKTSMTRLASPNTVVRPRYAGTEISDDFARTVLLFVWLFLFIMIVGAALLMMTGLDFATAFSCALTTTANIGSGFGSPVGSVGNFAAINTPALYIMSFLMLAGRLEIITVLILFMPSFWRR